MSAVIRQHYWGPIGEVVRFVERLTQPLKAILEIGPGNTPFSRANLFVDDRLYPALSGKQVFSLDLNADPLPFADKSIDFVYCRHTLEDLCNPFLACREMNRVAKAGYIETPSPLAECCRGVDGGQSPAWRGYHHHHYLLWKEGPCLMIYHKYPLIEHVDFGAAESQMVDLLNTSAIYWNTYFLWEGHLQYRQATYPDGQALYGHFGNLLLRAINRGIENAQEMAALVSRPW